MYQLSTALKEGVGGLLSGYHKLLRKAVNDDSTSNSWEILFIREADEMRTYRDLPK